MATMAGTALAESPTESILPAVTPRRTSGSELLPAVRAGAFLRPIARLPEGVIAGLPGAVTGLAVSRDGAHLVAAHYGEDAVSLIGTATLEVTATVDGIDEPYAVAAADRAYLRSASIVEDTVVAVDLQTGAALADREVGVGAGGLDASPSGDTLYVARSVDGVADIAVIHVESGKVGAIPVTRTAGASIDSVRINAAGTRLYAALTCATGGALVVVDIRSGRVTTVPVGAAVGEIAVHGDDRRVFVTGWDADRGATLYVVDTASARVLDSVALDGVPVGIVAAGSAVYVAHGEQISILDAGTLQTVSTVDIGRSVSCLTVSRDETRLYVGDYHGMITAVAAPALARGARAA
jgi:DNA-binding beta-propeller fold protein YncE